MSKVPEGSSCSQIRISKILSVGLLHSSTFLIIALDSTGLHREEDFEGIVEIEDCMLQDETANEILALIKGHVADLQSKVSLLCRP